MLLSTRLFASNLCTIPSKLLPITAPGHFYRDLNPLILNLKNTLERSPSATAFTDHFASPSPSTAPSVISSVLSLSPSNPSVKVSRTPYPLTYKVEDYVQLAAYAYFLQHGTLVPQSALPEGVTDEEYLGGVMSFSNNDLPRYVVGRAIERDEKSIGSCKELVNELFEELSEVRLRGRVGEGLEDEKWLHQWLHQ